MAEIIRTTIDVDINTSTAAAELRKLQQQINAFNLTLNKGNAAQAQSAQVWTDSLSKAVNRSGLFKSELIRLDTSAKALDSTLRKGQATLGQFFSAAFNKRSAMAAETFALAAERARTMQTQFIATGKASKGMQEALAIRPLSAFSSEAAIASQRVQILSNMFRQGTTQLINFGKNVQWAGRQLMVGFTVPLTIFGSTAGRVFKDLEKQTVAFKKVYGDIFTTPAELQQNLDAVMSLGKEYTKYGVAVKDTIGLAAQAAAAGRKNADLTDAVEQATRLATLGQMDQNAALDTTIALQSAFRISGQELADTINFLNMVENQTVVSLQDIAAAIPRVAPVIKGLGGDVKDLTVFLAAMQEGGVSAEEGANALKSGLASLINPTRAATETLSGFGINLDAIINANKGDLMATVRGFAEALSTLDQFSRQQALEQVFGKFQYARLGALFENIVRDGSQANQVMQTMGYSSQQLASVANKELKTISDSFGVQLTAAIEKFKLAIAPLGQLFVQLAIPIVNWVTKIVNWFNSLPDSTKKLVALATIVSGVVVPALTMMFGLFMNLIGTLAKMTQGFGIFGATLVKSGPIAALKSLSQSSKYLSLAEIDAANAATQLGSATSIANTALRQQVSTAGQTTIAINQLTTAYQRLIAEQILASKMGGTYFGPGAAANTMTGGKPNIVTRTASKIKWVGKNAGGPIVPGTGNTDTVPAMLTPGEFVVNKQSTQQNFGLLNAINSGQRFNSGGFVQYFQDGGDVKRNKFNYNGKDYFGSSPEAKGLLEYASKNHKGLLPVIMEDIENSKYYKNKGKINLEIIADAIKKYALPSMQIDTIKGLSGATHKSHAASPMMKVLDKTIQTHLGYIPAGTPLALLTDRVLDLPYQANYDLRGGKISGNSLRSAILSQDHNGLNIFRTMDDQFYQYLKSIKQSTNGELISQYKNARSASLRDILLHLQTTGPGLVDDKRFSNIANSVFDANFKDNDLNKFMSAIMSPGRNVRFQTLPELQITAKSFNINTEGKGIAQLYDEILAVTNPGAQKPIKYADLLDQKTAKVRGNLLMGFLSYAKRGAKTLRYLNAGGSVVPGTGNTDTVPAMLTPGEFVVSKDAAQNNMGLLSAINNGKTRKYAVGGVVRGIGTTVGYGAVGTGAYYGLEGMGANSLVSIAGSIAVPAVLQKLMPVIAQFGLAGGVATAAFGGLAVGTYLVVKDLEKMRTSTGKLVDAMYGTTNTIENFAKAFQRETPEQRLTSMMAQKTGGVVGTEAKAVSSSFIQSTAGKQILKDIETAKKEGKDTVTLLKNQLAQVVLAGVITPEEARAVAIDIGNELNDQKLAVNVSAKLTELLGENGELITNNRIKIIADVSPVLDYSAINAEAEKQYADSNPITRLFGGPRAEEVAKITLDGITKSVVASARIQKESMTDVNLKYLEGTYTLDEYKKKVLELDTQARQGTKKTLELFSQGLGKSNIEEINKLAKETVDIQTSWDGKTSKQATTQAKIAQQSINDLVSQYQEAYFEINGITSETQKQSLINGIKSAFDSGEPTDILIGWIQLLQGYIDKATVDGMKSGANEVMSRGKLEQGQRDKAAAEAAGILNTKDFVPTPAELSPLEQFTKGYNDLRKNAQAFYEMIGTGKNKLSIENASLLEQNGLLQINANQRKKVVQQIKDQNDIQAALNYLRKTGEEKAIDNANKEIRRIQRLNELDQQKIRIRQAGLDAIAKKEEAINKAYDARVTALDAVAQMNQRLEQQRQSRISLAGALVSGDIGAAAQAASSMATSFAQYQTEDARAALEKSRADAIAAIQVSINGTLMTRQQIMDSIEQIQKDMYDRDTLIQTQQTIIFDNEELLRLKEEERIENGRKLLANGKAIKTETDKALQAAINYTAKLAEPVTKTITIQYVYQTSTRPSGSGAFGGQFAMGGMYSGSKEPPPPMKMAMGGRYKKYKNGGFAPGAGGLIPGLGNVDNFNALLMPGEYVVRKNATRAFKPLLDAMNYNVFPDMRDLIKTADIPNASSMSNNNVITNNTPVYNSYNVNLNVPNSNANAEDIANAVAIQIRRISNSNIKGISR